MSADIKVIVAWVAYPEAIVEMIVVELRPNLRIGRVGRAVELPIDVHETGKTNKHMFAYTKLRSHVASRGCRVLRSADVAMSKLKIDPRLSSKPSSTRIGMASMSADVTSWLNKLLVLAVAPRAAVKLDVWIRTSSDSPGTGIPRVSSTARIT